MGSEEVIGRLYELVSPVLDERARRLLVGAGATIFGRGGISAVSKACGVERHTVAAGVSDLRDLGTGFRAPGASGVRRPGAGRKPLVESDTQLEEALLTLVSPTTRGDPETPLLWTCKSTRVLADELTSRGHTISARSVATLLRGKGYSLQANAKVIEGGQHPDRNAQFEHVNTRVQIQMQAGLPAISVDTKKKELVGEFKNGGREWRPKGDPELVKVHDFVDAEKGRASPYGIYDIANDMGWVNVGVDHDTAAFAVESIRQWWHTMGQPLYPNADNLLITADGGGSNGSRVRLWKLELQKFADETGLTISVCHFPPGTSKWNKIEHRLFSFITMNWRGRPLISHEAIVSLIGSTKTRSGLQVASRLDTNEYPAGIKVSDEQLASVNLTREEFHGEWNYSVAPRSL
jgi:hypothetical protein